jgi:hypothetical protein
MLSKEEKREMLEDAKNWLRRDSLRFARDKNSNTISFEDYINFLNNIQEIFEPFKISQQITITRINKL